MSDKLKQRTEKRRIQVSQASSALIESGLSIIKRQNNSESCADVTHITVIGPARTVEFFPSSGKAYSNGVKGRFAMVSGHGVEWVISTAKGV